MDKMMLGQKRKGPTESMKKVQGELQHLQSLKLVEDLLERQNSMISENKDSDSGQMFETLTKMKAELMHRISFKGNVQQGLLPQSDINR